MDEKPTPFQELWALQGQLFQAQRELINWMGRFVPPFGVEMMEYTKQVGAINSLIRRIKECEIEAGLRKETIN